MAKLKQINTETEVYTTSEVNTELWTKQDTLVSWTNIKTINWDSLLWSGDITISWWESSFSTTTATIDWSTGNNKEITITADTNIVHSSLPNWQTCYLRIINWGNFVVWWSTTTYWAWWVAPVLTEDWVDIIALKFNWTRLDADYSTNFAFAFS